MLNAITRAASPALANCELSFVPRQPIDIVKARAQHRAYEELLAKLGARVVSLPEEPELPDSMFVEDPAIVLPEVAVICPLVLRIGKEIFAGLTQRSNPEGIRQFVTIVDHYGYAVTVVPVTRCLHLKSAVTFLGKNTLLANRNWFEWKRLEGFEWIDVDPSEPHAANALVIGDTVVLAASFPRTKEKVETHGFPVVTLDISELQKAEAGLTCSSLLFDT